MFIRKIYPLLILSILIPFAQLTSASPLSVTTDKQTYYPGDVISVSGTTEPDSDVTVQLYNPNGVMVDIDYKVSSSNGYYSITFKIPIKIPTGSWIYGAYTVRAYSVGQIKNATFTLLTLVDTTPPTIISVSPAEGATVNILNPILSVLYSDDVAIDFSSARLVLDGTDVTSGATITSNRIDYMPTTNLMEGTHTVYFEVKDLAGNKATETWSFTVSMPDFLPPIVHSVYPQKDAILNTRTVTISATYSDNKGVDPYSISLKVDGNAINITSITPSSLTASASLTDGSHFATLSLMDTSGNQAIVNWTFVIDATPPSITGDILNNNTVFQNKEIKFTLSISDNIALNASSLIMRIDGSAVAPIVNLTAVTYSGNLTEGSHTVQVSVNDMAGNTASRVFTFSITPPTNYMVYILVAAFVAVIALVIIFVLKRV